MLTLCLAANVRNFVRFACSSAVQSSIHFGLTPPRITGKGSSETQKLAVFIVVTLNASGILSLKILLMNSQFIFSQYLADNNENSSRRYLQAMYCMWNINCGLKSKEYSSAKQLVISIDIAIVTAVACFVP